MFFTLLKYDRSTYSLLFEVCRGVYFFQAMIKIFLGHYPGGCTANSCQVKLEVLTISRSL
jgi:hypothetical protein